MFYKLVKKEESAAPAVLYGEGAMRYLLAFEHTVGSKPDNYSTNIYVDYHTFDRFNIGDVVQIALGVVPVTVPDDVA